MLTRITQGIQQSQLKLTPNVLNNNQTQRRAFCSLPSGTSNTTKSLDFRALDITSNTLGKFYKEEILNNKALTLDQKKEILDRIEEFETLPFSDRAPCKKKSLKDAFGCIFFNKRLDQFEQYNIRCIVDDPERYLTDIHVGLINLFKAALEQSRNNNTE